MLIGKRRSRREERVVLGEREDRDR